MSKYKVGGFEYDNEQDAQKAAKELKAVEYILGQIKESNDEQAVHRLYVRLIDQNLFSTEVGLSFLNQIRDNLLKTGKFKEDELPVNNYSKKIKNDTNVSKKKSDKPKKGSSANKVSSNEVSPKKEFSSKDYIRLKKINSFLIVCCITLVLCVLGMFYVSSTINSPTILNYEEELLDKYSSWEQDLTEREEALRTKERGN